MGMLAIDQAILREQIKRGGMGGGGLGIEDEMRVQDLWRYHRRYLFLVIG